MTSTYGSLQEQERIIYRGNIHLPEIALTFDDGPDPQKDILGHVNIRTGM